MLRAAVLLLTLAVLLGGWLAILHLRPERTDAPWLVRMVHGVAGGGGLTLLLAMRLGPEADFARAGMALMGAALVLGLAFWLAWERLGRIRDATLILHAFLAITGFVLLSGWFLNR